MNIDYQFELCIISGVAFFMFYTSVAYKFYDDMIFTKITG